MLKTHLLPFVLFLGNWSMILIGPIPSDSLSVLWSVCVEEQFYLIVPLLIALVSRGSGSRWSAFCSWARSRCAGYTRPARGRHS